VKQAETKKMSRREQWRPVLEAEVKKWSARSWAELVAELANRQAYEIEFEGKAYQVEVQLLEKTDRYVHVGVSVDDGSVPASFRPVSESFIRDKGRREGEPT
jgi:hypothetical protein